LILRDSSSRNSQLPKQYSSLIDYSRQSPIARLAVSRKPLAAYCLALISETNFDRSQTSAGKTLLRVKTLCVNS
jgi:hypothetical protein